MPTCCPHSWSLTLRGTNLRRCSFTDKAREAGFSLRSVPSPLLALFACSVPPPAAPGVQMLTQLTERPMSPWCWCRMSPSSEAQGQGRGLWLKTQGRRRVGDSRDREWPSRVASRPTPPSPGCTQAGQDPGMLGSGGPSEASPVRKAGQCSGARAGCFQDAGRPPQPRGHGRRASEPCLPSALRAQNRALGSREAGRDAVVLLVCLTAAPERSTRLAPESAQERRLRVPGRVRGARVLPLTSRGCRQLGQARSVKV